MDKEAHENELKQALHLTASLETLTQIPHTTGAGLDPDRI